MANKLFDNLVKILEGASIFTTSTLVSLELDFELPRGFVAKIHAVELEIRNYGEDMEGLGTDKYWRQLIALILDPDDITTITFPGNTVEHDVLATLTTEFSAEAGTAGDPGWANFLPYKFLNFDQMGVDVITARNMRLNINGAGTDVASVTESIGAATIYYTLEKVTDNDVLNLLDIL